MSITFWRFWPKSGVRIVGEMHFEALQLCPAKGEPLKACHAQQAFDWLLLSDLPSMFGGQRFQKGQVASTRGFSSKIRTCLLAMHELQGRLLDD